MKHVIWRHRSRSTLAQVITCCLMIPSHHLNQCWFIISTVLWHSLEGSFSGNAQDISPWYQFENYEFKITVLSSRGQWVNIPWQIAQREVPDFPPIKILQYNVDLHKFHVILAFKKAPKVQYGWASRTWKTDLIPGGNIWNVDIIFFYLEKIKLL